MPCTPWLAAFAGIGLVNLVWYGLERQHSIPIDYRVYDKDTDGKVTLP
ncbi:hypothetical protein [Piscirickettsia salmonis]|nr:hypothetical protein [Piscirickettsia salmonis]